MVLTVPGVLRVLGATLDDRDVDSEFPVPGRDSTGTSLTDAGEDVE